MSGSTMRVRAVAGMAAIAVAIAALTASGATARQARGSGKTIQFGQIADFTGVGSAVISYANAATLSSEYAINAGGGILGAKVVNVPIDTKSDPADGLTAVDRALATNNIAVVNGPLTDTAPVVVPILQRHNIITICPCGNPNFDHTTDPYFWRLVPPDPVGGEAMSLYAQHNHYTRVAAVFGTDQGSQGDLPGVLFGVKATGLHLVAKVGLTPDQTSYRTQVEQLIQAKPQVIFTESDGPTAATFFGELKQLGKLMPIYGTNATIQTPYLKALSAAIGTSGLEQYYRGEANANAPSSPAGAAYNAAVTKIANKLPKPVSQWLNNPFVEANYDGFIMAALAMQASHSTDPKVANNWIPKITEPGHGKTIVYSYAAGVKALKAGKHIQYVGAAGPIKFDKWHNSFPDQAMQKVNVNGAPTSSVTIPAAEIQKLK
jgi:ABC-type branched-subunit amino acid transport system substrate-binding protein